MSPSDSRSHFASRSAADIVGLGKAKIADLFELGYLSTAADIYTLRDKLQVEALLPKSDNSTGLLAASGWGLKSVSNLLANIEKRREIPFPKYVSVTSLPASFALNIRACVGFCMPWESDKWAR